MTSSGRRQSSAGAPAHELEDALIVREVDLTGCRCVSSQSTKLACTSSILLPGACKVFASVMITPCLLRGFKEALTYLLLFKYVECCHAVCTFSLRA